MQRIYTVFISLILLPFLVLPISFEAHAQSNWRWQNPLPQGNTLNSMQVIDRGTIVAVGEQGTFIKSIDSGATWVVQTFIGGTPGNLQSVYFTDTLNGMAIDYYPGNVYSTGNGGKKWGSAILSGGLNRICFDGPNTGFIISDSGYVFRSVDAGNNWQQLPAVSLKPLIDIQFTAIDTGFVLANNGDIYRSSDTGATWDLYISAPPGSGFPKNQYRDFYCFNSNNISAVGKPNLIYTTHDGGANWIAGNISTAEDFQSIYFTTIDSGIAVAGYHNEHYGDAFQTTDSGRTWNAVQHVNYYPRSIGFIDHQKGFIVGLKGDMLATTDGGSTWSQNFDYVDVFNAVAFHGNNGILIGYPVDNGSNFSLTSADRGKTWSKKSTDITNQVLYKVAFTGADDNTAVAIGGWTSIYRTTDAGHSWTRIHSPLVDTSVYFLGLSFPTKDTGYISAALGIVLKTVDGGLTWDSIYRLPVYNATTTCFVNGHKGFASQGLFLKMYMTEDGGQTWDSTTLEPSYDGNINDIIFLNDQEGIAVGEDVNGGLICRTANGGKSWDVIPNTVFSGFNSVSFANDTGVIVGELGNILQSTDAGQTWQQINSPIAVDNLTSVKLITGGTGTIAGQDIILHEEETGLVIITSTPGVTGNSLLSNLFPNPLTNQAQFTLSLPENSPVKLSVYNLLGEQVQLLANKPMSKGTYSFEWTPAKSLTAGIYFLRLEVNGVLQENRKAVLTR